MDLTLTQEEYEALTFLAQKGANSAGDLSPMSDKVRELKAFLTVIEKRNGIFRYAVWIRWQDPKVLLPPTTDFPGTWPPTQQYLLEQTGRAIARADVEAALTRVAKEPIGVLVTSDPGAYYGWQTLDQYFK